MAASKTAALAAEGEATKMAVVATAVGSARMAIVEHRRVKAGTEGLVNIRDVPCTQQQCERSVSGHGRDS